MSVNNDDYVSGGVYVHTDLRAPILYDGNNTAYYDDPASTSRFNVVHANYFLGEITDSGSGDGNAPFRFESDYSGWATIFAGTPGSSNGWGTFWAGNDNAAYRYFDTVNPNEYVFVGNGGVRASIDLDNGQSYFDTSIRSPIFYDSNNTGYYVDPASTDYSARFAGNLYFVGYPKIGIEDGGMDCYLYITDNNPVVDGVGYGGEFYFYGDKSISSSYLNFGGAVVEQTLRANGSLRAPIFYNHTDTAYYVDPNVGFYLFADSNSAVINGTSSSSGLIIQNNSSGGPKLSLKSTAASGKDLWLISNNTDNTDGAGRLQFWNNTDGYTFATLGTTAGANHFIYGAYTQMSGSARAPIFYDSANTGYYFDGNATGTSINVAGSIVAAGNVTAYSDIRLKTNIEIIPNALDKVKKLRGVTFDRTDNPDVGRQTGVIAQEVKEVLPEAVSGHELTQYTVAYGNMVGLLIEAIKEQDAKIERLEALVETLINKLGE